MAKKYPIQSKPVKAAGTSIPTATFTLDYKYFIWIILLLSGIAMIAVFNPNISLSGDDAGYIIRAMEFKKSFTYPGDQSTLYSIFLSFFALISNTNIFILKLTSFACILGFIYLFYTFYVHKVPVSIVLLTLVVTALSPIIAFYGSQTFSEALFMLLSILIFHIFFRYVKIIENRDFNSSDLKPIAILCASVFALYLSRTVGVFISGAAIIYLILNKKWKATGAICIGLITCLVLFNGLKAAIWKQDMFSNAQATVLLNKDAYDPSKGREDLSGFIDRFTVNSNQYLSTHFMRIIGLKKQGDTSTNSVVTILFYIIYLFLLYKAYFKNKYLFFTGLFGLIMCLLTFLLLQTFWNQDRLIVPFVPYMLLFIFGTTYLSVPDSIKSLRMVVPIFLGLLCLLCLVQLARQANIKGFSAGLMGDKYYGFPTEWKNYLEASEYAGKTIQGNEGIACRKSEMSKIYGNHKNFIMYNSSAMADNVDSLLSNFKRSNVQYFLLDQCFGTFGNYYNAIEGKYPGTLSTIKQFGQQNARPSVLFKVNYKN